MENKEIKYSIVWAGKKYSDYKDAMKEYLVQGIKILWFGEKSDIEEINKEDELQEYLNERYLMCYEYVGEELEVIDGNNLGLVKNKLKDIEKFNLPQYEAEHCGADQNITVKAGAGAGKTKVMIDRILFLLATQDNLCLDDIAMLTFTNAATDEMREKLRKEIGNKYKTTHNVKYLKYMEQIVNFDISTIDSFMKNRVKEFGPKVGFGTDVAVRKLDYELEHEIEKQIDDYRERNNLKDYISNDLGMSQYNLKTLIQSILKKIIGYGISLNDVKKADWCVDVADDVKTQKVKAVVKELLPILYEDYLTYQKKSNCMSMECIKIVINDIVDTLKKDDIRKTYKYIFIDEFQDCDDSQIGLFIKLISLYREKNAKAASYIYAVGDDKQGIYSFRGASYKAFDILNEKLKEYNIVDPYVIELLKNYRTQKDLMENENNLFLKWNAEGYLNYGNPMQAEKEGDYKCDLRKEVNCVWSDKYRCLLPDAVGQQQLTDLLKALRDKEMKRRVALSQNEQERDRKNNNSIMVITRNNKQLKVLSDWCEAEHIPCKINKDGGFYQADAVKDFRCFVDVLVYNDNIKYIFNYLNSSYAATSFSKAEIDTFNDNQIGLDNRKNMLEATVEFGNIQKYIDRFKMNPVMQSIDQLIKEINPVEKYVSIKRTELKRKYENLSDSDLNDQLDILEEIYRQDLNQLLVEIMENCDKTTLSLFDISEYLRRKSYNTETERQSNEIDDYKNVFIEGITAHRSKGLQYKYVVIPFSYESYIEPEFIIDKDNGILRIGLNAKKINKKKDNNANIANNAIYQQLDAENKREQYKDETRMLYVAMTRAISELYCFSASGSVKKCDEMIWSSLLNI